MERAIRVLQVADLNLHEPLEPVGRLPAPLREIFNQARERSALKVHQAAISNNVDLLLLTGPLADFAAEPRLACFLMEQFRRLQAAGVNVVWAADRSSLLPIWSLRPEHVTCLLPGQSVAVFTGGTSHQMLIHHASREISPARSASDFQAAGRDLILMVSTAPGAHSAQYSGPFAVQTLQQEIHPVQPAGPVDRGTFGMRLIELVAGERPRSKLLPVSTVEWTRETINLTGSSTRASLLAEMQQCAHHKSLSQQGELICLEWVLTGTSPLWDELLTEIQAEQLLQEIRQLVGRDSRVWSWRIHLRPAAEQFRLWEEAPAMAEGLRQLEQLSTSDLAASASVPGSAGEFLRGPILTQTELGGYRVRLARELRTPLRVGSMGSGLQ